jgi:hypothetical protein
MTHPDFGALAADSAASSSVQSESHAAPPDVCQGCIQFIIDASAKEERAMVFDRAGAYPGAVNLYREASALLSEALHLMPEDHTDAAVVGAHNREVLARAAYLYSLGVQPADIPLEQHIHGAQLSIGTCAKGSKTSMAAGALVGATGLVLIGPLTGVALAAGAAYATTRQDDIGKAARSVGDAGLRAVDSTRAFTEERRIAEKLDEKLEISESASYLDRTLHISTITQKAGDTVRSIDEKFAISESTSMVAAKTHAFVNGVDGQLGISSKSGVVASKTAQVLSEFDETHQVTDKMKYNLEKARSSVTDWICRTADKAFPASDSSQANQKS